MGGALRPLVRYHEKFLQATGYAAWSTGQHQCSSSIRGRSGLRQGVDGRGHRRCYVTPPDPLAFYGHDQQQGPPPPHRWAHHSPRQRARRACHHGGGRVRALDRSETGPAFSRASASLGGAVTIATRTIVADALTPVRAYAALRDADPNGASFLLETLVAGERWGRWSFLGYRPRYEAVLDRQGWKLH